MRKGKPLDQQVMVITGATSGIGLATVRAVAAAGARVVMVARGEADLSRIAAELKSQGRDVTFAVCCQGSYAESARYRDFMGWEVPWYSG